MRIGGSAMKRLIAFVALWLITVLSAAAETESRIVYLYVPACESCARAARVLDSLPDSVRIGDTDSAVVIERLDVSAEPERATKIFEQYQVPEARQITPMVLLGETYLSGIDEIERDLADMVAQGMAIDIKAAAKGLKPIQDGDEVDEPAQHSAFPLIGTLGAGLIAGLNTCALSMLLLFLSLVIEARRPAGVLAACFLGAKFACYLLIGFVFVGVMQRLNPHWLQPLAKGLLTGIGAVLIVLNLWDAIQARREAFGNVHNQLPARMRGRLHRWIRMLTRSRVLIPASVLLGFIVAAGEFLCAGQIYLMRLLGAVQSGTGTTAVQLVAYCAAFIAPSAALCALVLKGKNQLRVSEFLAEHMATVKVLTAIAMLGLVLLAWIN